MSQPRELLKAADIEAMEAVASPHPLNPNALRLRKSLGDATGLTQLGFHRIELMPGRDSSEYHYHHYEEECVYVLAGHGRALIGEQAHAIGTGDFLGFARNGPAHVITNTGDIVVPVCARNLGFWLKGLMGAPTSTQGKAATGSFTSNGTQPTSNSTLTINGSTWTFVSALTTGLQILIGATLTDTINNAVLALNASTDTNTAVASYFADTDKVMDLEQRLLWCMTNIQGLDTKDVIARRFSGPGKASDMEDLVAFIANKSNGMKIDIPLSHPKEQEMAAVGEALFYRRGGVNDFSCSTCHAEEGKRIRLQGLPDLSKPGKQPQETMAGWPTYRVSQGALRTMQHRLWDCYRQQRWPVPEYASDALTALTVFLQKQAAGAEINVPSIKR